MKLILLLLTAVILFTANSPFAQDKSVFKFNKITKEDFAPKIYSIDSNAAAVILADVGSTGFVGNKKGWFTLVFKRHRRIRVLKNSAMELATTRIPLYKKEDDQEILEDVKGTTYNESSGNITETALDKHDLFEEKLDKNHTEKKFTMPAVKEGSIIEIEYTIKSDFTFNLQPWTFQHMNYPCLWSEYAISVPGLLNYVFLKQGYNKYFIEKKETKSKGYQVTMPSDNVAILGLDRSFFINTVDIKCLWVMKDLPGFNHVDYISSPENYLDKIEFQLSQMSNGETVTDVMNTWPKVMEQLLKEEDFGAGLSPDNYWLDDDVRIATNGSMDQMERSERIYEFVKNKYTCTGEGFLIRTKLYDVFKNRKGNTGEINLILISMLRKSGITADPVLLSTLSNGRPHDNYPILSKYNYVICTAAINNANYYLDATHAALGFGRLDPECYNGQARVVNYLATGINLSGDSLKENKNTYVLISEDNGVLKGTVSKMPGYYESYHLREIIAKDGKDYFFNEIKKSFPEEMPVSNLQIDSLDQLTQPLGIHYDFIIKPGQNNTIYLNPLFGEGYEKNFFKSEERILPVEMSFPSNRVYTLNLEIPSGYIVDEIPKPVMLKLNEKGDGLFEYLVQVNEERISLRTRLIIKRSFFGPDEYDTLREFFNLIVKKQSESIVFKKKN